MEKYKVLVEFTTPAVEAAEGVEAQDEVKFAVGQEVEMEAEKAAPLVEAGNLELIPAA